MSTAKVLALTGGVGGAKLALGLSKVLDPGEVVFAANTADDFEHCGLSISPDLDTLLYTLAGVNDKQRGWGLAKESWQVMESLAAIGGDSWFRLGDRDLATHLERTRRLSRGESLTEVTQALCRQFGVEQCIVPMSDDPVRTIVEVYGENQAESRLLSFQEYFVREQCQPSILSVHFKHIDQAKPHPDILRLLDDPELMAVVICPSNPFVSIDPILYLSQVRRALRQVPAPVVAVSPIIAGDAVKGPTAKIMREMGMPVTAPAIARYYSDFIDGFVLDDKDKELMPSIQDMGLAVCCTNTLMRTLSDRVALAETTLQFCQTLPHRGSLANLAAN